MEVKGHLNQLTCCIYIFNIKTFHVFFLKY